MGTTEKSRKPQWSFWFEVLKLWLAVATNGNCGFIVAPSLTQCILKTVETRVDLVELVV